MRVLVRFRMGAESQPAPVLGRRTGGLRLGACVSGVIGRPVLWEENLDHWKGAFLVVLV